MFKCPICGKPAKVVWRSKDGRTVAIRCNSLHEYGEAKSLLYWDEKAQTFRYTGRRKRYVSGLVFLVSINDLEEVE